MTAAQKLKVLLTEHAQSVGKQQDLNRHSAEKIFIELGTTTGTILMIIGMTILGKSVLHTFYHIDAFIGVLIGTLGIAIIKAGRHMSSK